MPFAYCQNCDEELEGWRNAHKPCPICKTSNMSDAEAFTYLSEEVESFYTWAEQLNTIVHELKVLTKTFEKQLDTLAKALQ